jgi:protein-L-isoaspartate(D-aspartate) O-methyltransferase
VLAAACAAATWLGAGCAEGGEQVDDGPDWQAMRDRMVDRQIEARGVADARVLAAMRKVPRHAFVPDELAPYAYEDRPLPIGHRQTISQPYIVAAMTEAIRPEPGDRILEIGTGSGYQAAVLAEVVEHVYTIEIVEPLGEQARRTLEELGYGNVSVRVGDGFAGWPEEAPFDAIVVTAAPEEIPPPLIEQLAEGGRLVIPVGDTFQELRLVTRSPAGLVTEDLMPVRFVPMTGRAQEGPASER